MSEQPETHHPLVRWVYARWPKWVKWCAVVAAVFGWLGTFMGWGGRITDAIHWHDVRVQAAAIAAQLDKQRDDRVDQTLAEHGKAIEETKVGVNAIRSTLAKQDVELLDRKDQLNRIETAIMMGAARPLLSPSPGAFSALTKRKGS